MRFKIILSFVIFALTFINGLEFVTASDDAPDKPVEKVQKKQGYALVMANGTKIKISRYEIDQEKGTVFYKSKLSGLSATFPLERIKRVVKYDINLVDVPDDAMPLFIPEQTIQSRDDDGGIPILFKVKKTIVGGGGSNSYSRAGGSRSSDYRSNYRGSSKSSRSNSSYSKTPSRSNTSSTSSSSGRTSSSGSSGGSADNFFDALFGGKH